MPRNGPGKKPANQHNNRHENGLVGPGKRIVKQKSNGHLNGSPASGSQSSTPPLPTPSTEQPLSLGDEHNLNGSLKDLKHDLNGLTTLDGLRTRDPVTSDDQPDFCQNGTVYPISSEAHSTRQNDSNPAKADMTFTVNPLRLASSIVTACPIQDTIALLIFLLQLPPALLTLTQYLFTTLTFVPASIGPMSALVDLSKSSPGAPTTITIVAVSCVSIMCMLPLWTPVQNFALDVAQVQIAITLGGGQSNNSGYLDSAFVCILVVSAMHLSQSRDVRHFLTENVLSSWLFDFVRPRLPHISQTLQPFSLVKTDHFRRTPPGWVQLIPAGHILGQAAMRIVRRWIFNKNMKQQVNPGRAGDTEASAGSASQDPVSENASTTIHLTDGHVNPPPNKIQEKTERISNTKKRKRQQTLVRSQQPFWAALASTKVSVMREYEQSRNTAPGIGTAKSREEFSATIIEVMGEESRVWVMQVQPTVIKFEVCCATFADQEDSSKAMRPTPPFYMRVNGANWASASIYPTTLTPTTQDNGMQHWTGEISGLAPNSVYQCSMVRCDNEMEFCVLNLKTPAAPDAELSSTIVPSAREPFRPDSPTTTMRNSIAAADNKLNDARARLKRGRRDHKNAQNHLRKEAETLNNRLTSSGGGDEKQKQRRLQMEQEIKRAEEACVSFDTLLSELETIPEEEISDWTSHKSTHNTEKNSLLSARNEFSSGRANCKGELHNLQQDLSHAQKAMEKARRYQTKLQDQTNSIAHAKSLGLSEQDRKAAERFSKEQTRREIEKTFTEQFQYLNQGISSERGRTQMFWAQITHIEHQQQQAAAQAEQAQQQLHLLGLRQSSGPLTPEGDLPGTHSPSSSTRNNFPFPFPFPSLAGPSNLDHSTSNMFPQPSQPSPRLPFVSPSLLSASARARSSSIRSAHSAFTDFSDADPIPPLPGIGSEDMAFVAPPRNNSNGSAHNSSPGLQNNSPVSRGKGSPGIWK